MYERLLLLAWLFADWFAFRCNLLDLGIYKCDTRETVGGVRQRCILKRHHRTLLYYSEHFIQPNLVRNKDDNDRKREKRRQGVAGFNDKNENGLGSRCKNNKIEGVN